MEIDNEHQMEAPGRPGTAPRWTSSSKSGIGKAMNGTSNVAFSVSHGTLNEVFYPREDIACVRDMELIITDGKDFFSEEKRDTDHDIKWIGEGVPAYKMTNICRQKKYIIHKEILTDPIRNSLLQKITITNIDKETTPHLNLYFILAPHIHNQGADNNGWTGDYKGEPMLFAQRNDTTLAIACSSPFLKRSVGFVGESDGYTDLFQHKKMAWEYQNAKKGNIALTGQLDLSVSETFVIAIGFGETAKEAANSALASILDGFKIAKEKYVYEWEKWQRLLTNIKSNRNRIGKDFRSSAAVLRMHESKKFPGGIIASLSIPWGQSKGDGELGGYHLVWPRDLVLSSGGFLALGNKDDVIRILNYLMTTQEDDGRWSQNMWLEGVPYWNGIQMDQIALAVLLVHIAFKHEYLEPKRLDRYWPKVKKALTYLLKNGPATQQDRWEEEEGYTPFTLSVEIAAMLAGAGIAEAKKEPELAKYCRETADWWNDNIERWLYVTDTAVSREVGVEGYYMRINPYDLPASEVKNRVINIKNHEGEEGKMALSDLVCVDALALVRFGLRDANDPKILNTIKVIDAKLKMDTPGGPCWYRYTNDGYGEDAQGNFSSTKGIGRPWPLLAGERGHYEIAAGNIEQAIDLLKAMEHFSENSLLPEQIWDKTDIPEKGLYSGKHSGSAMPLTWAHAEYIKLCCSIKNKTVTDMPFFTKERYVSKTSPSPYIAWSFAQQRAFIPMNKYLRVEVRTSAKVRWTEDNWQTSHDVDTRDTGLGMHIADIFPKNEKGEDIFFTFYWNEAKRWEMKNFKITFR